MADSASLDTIAEQVRGLSKSVDERFDAQDDKLNDYLVLTHEHAERLRETERSITRLQEQTKTWHAFLTGLSVLGAAIAARLGMTH